MWAYILCDTGSPCNNFRGYCDVFHKCRGVDADGPLARLKNLIFDPKTLQSIKDWIVVGTHFWQLLVHVDFTLELFPSVCFYLGRFVACKRSALAVEFLARPFPSNSKLKTFVFSKYFS